MTKFHSQSKQIKHCIVELQRPPNGIVVPLVPAFFNLVQYIYRWPAYEDVLLFRDRSLQIWFSTMAYNRPYGKVALLSSCY